MSSARRRHARDRVAGRLVRRLAEPEPDGLDSGRGRPGRGGGLPLEPQRRDHGGGTAEASRSGGAVRSGQECFTSRPRSRLRSIGGRSFPLRVPPFSGRGARSCCRSGSWRACARRARRPAGRSADGRPHRVRTARRAHDRGDHRSAVVHARTVAVGPESGSHRGIAGEPPEPDRPGRWNLARAVRHGCARCASVWRSNGRRDAACAQRLPGDRAGRPRRRLVAPAGAGNGDPRSRAHDPGRGAGKGSPAARRHARRRPLRLGPRRLRPPVARASLYQSLRLWRAVRVQRRDPFR